jgi:hypothetical protein
LKKGILSKKQQAPPAKDIFGALKEIQKLKELDLSCLFFFFVVVVVVLQIVGFFETLIPFFLLVFITTDNNIFIEDASVFEFLEASKYLRHLNLQSTSSFTSSFCLFCLFQN